MQPEYSYFKHRSDVFLVTETIKLNSGIYILENLKWSQYYEESTPATDNEETCSLFYRYSMLYGNISFWLQRIITRYFLYPYPYSDSCKDNYNITICAVQVR
jgi:hypothetical protein